MIKVITGAMFSGKSFELIELLRQLDINMHKGDKKEKEGVDGLKKNC